MPFDTMPAKKPAKMKQLRRAIRAQLLPLVDLIFSPFIFLAAILLKRVRRIGVHKLPISKNILLNVGVFPVQDHYYEPLFNHKDLIHPLSDDRLLPGIDWNTDHQLAQLNKLDYSGELNNIPLEKTDRLSFYLNNGAFGPGDAEYWYNIIRYKKPKRIIEIGSGKSTLLAIQALEKNKEEDPDYTCDHICIEPYAAPWLEETGIKVIRQKAEMVDISIYQSLQQGDILFIDSTHMIRPQGDVLFEYLTLLPQLNSGVLVHIHDIFSPRDYPEDWIIEKVVFWNEQYLLEAFLSQNPEWKITAALNFLFHRYKDEFLRVCPYAHKDKEPRSFYIEKI